MSETRHEARDARFDEAIDRAVREMLDVEPPAGLRGRVMHRIGRPAETFVASAFRRKAVWLGAPLAAAAILVLAILMPSESGRPVVAPPPKAAADVHLPAAPLASRAPRTRPPIVVAKGSTHPPRGRQSIAAATLPADSPVEGAQVEALAGPHPIAIDRLAGPPPPSVSDVGVAPIQIRALEISALTETRPERREE
jgi:hypothetical protein